MIIENVNIGRYAALKRRGPMLTPVETYRP